MFSLVGISVRVALICIVGGVGTVAGPLVGALLIIPLEELFNDWLSGAAAGVPQLAFGLILIVIILIEPRGLAALWRGCAIRPEEIMPDILKVSACGAGLAGSRPSTTCPFRGAGRHSGPDRTERRGQDHAVQPAGRVGGAQGGRIELDGRDVTGLRPHRIAALGMTKTFQNVALFPEMTVLDNVLVGGLLRHDVPRARQLAAQCLDRVGLSAIMGKLAADLSFPEQARVELARALCTGPRVFLLDEVMAALNDAEMDALLDLIRTLRDESGISFIVVEHHMRAIMRLCNRIMVLSFGQKIAEGAPAEIAANPTVIEVYLGKSMETQEVAA